MSVCDKTRRHVLVVDDEPGIRALLTRHLEAEGYAVTCASDGVDAQARIAEKSPDLMLLDLDMPRLGGFDVCARVKNDPRFRFLPIIILTARDESDARIKAWELGADEFLTKPFHRVEVSARCRSLLRVRDMVHELDSAESVLFALARAIEAKNKYTQGHTTRVTAYALALGGRIGLSDAEMKTLSRGAALHDIGKIAIPDAILDKPGRLTAEEYEIIKQHPLEGVRIVEPLRSTRDALPLIRWHHERRDGNGYPDGLFGAAIPLLARVLAVADVYDALTSERPYRAALPRQQGYVLLRDNAASGGLDPELVECFCSETPAWREREPISMSPAR